MGRLHRWQTRIASFDGRRRAEAARHCFRKAIRRCQRHDDLDHRFALSLKTDVCLRSISIDGENAEDHALPDPLSLLVLTQRRQLVYGRAKHQCDACRARHRACATNHGNDGRSGGNGSSDL